MNNWLGLVICFVYVFSIIGAAEGLRRWRGFPSGFTRKVIHVGVGMMSWGLHFLFDTPWFFVIACAAFMVINLLDWRYGFFAAMASSDRSNLGTVYFPFAAAIVALLFWEQPPLMVAALMPLTWGDGMAPVVGKAYGRRLYALPCYWFGWSGDWSESGGRWSCGEDEIPCSVHPPAECRDCRTLRDADVSPRQWQSANGNRGVPK